MINSIVKVFGNPIIIDVLRIFALVCAIIARHITTNVIFRRYFVFIGGFLHDKPTVSAIFAWWIRTVFHL